MKATKFGKQKFMIILLEHLLYKLKVKKAIIHEHMTAELGLNFVQWRTVDLTKATGKFSLVNNVKKITHSIYVAGFGVQYCNSMFISCFLFLLWPFTNFASSPNDWILELHSSAKTVIRQDSLGLRLLPFLSGARPKIECWIYTCLLTMFSHSAMSGVWLSPLLNIDDWSSKLS